MESWKNTSNAARDDENRRWDRCLKGLRWMVLLQRRRLLTHEFFQTAQEFERRGLLQRQTSVRMPSTKRSMAFVKPAAVVRAAKAPVRRLRFLLRQRR